MQLEHPETGTSQKTSITTRSSYAKLLITIEQLKLLHHLWHQPASSSSVVCFLCFEDRRASHCPVYSPYRWGGPRRNLLQPSRRHIDAMLDAAGSTDQSRKACRLARHLVTLLTDLRYLCLCSKSLAYTLYSKCTRDGSAQEACAR